MTLQARQVPENRGIAAEVIVGDAEGAEALLDLGLELPGLAEAGEVALHVGEKDGDAARRETLSDDLQRDGLAGTGGAGDQTMSIGIVEQQVERGRSLRDGDAGRYSHVVLL